ncbi:MAG: hypothetical protein IT293_19705 [Deltaproteobacteria bacterium]|nr:hypothetical protein [Deltaproteobacteria bacterium]
MPARAKAAILGAALVALTLWPLAHIGLVRRYDVNPWKLAGWGMYSAPRSRSLGMEVFGRPRGGGPLAHMAEPPPTVRDEASRYLERHRWLRRLARPAALAAAVAAAEPGWDEITIAVFEPELDRTSGMIVLRALVHRYTRDVRGVAYAGEVDPWRAGLPPPLLLQLTPSR